MTRFRVVASFLALVCLDEGFVAEGVRLADPRNREIEPDSIYDDRDFVGVSDPDVDFGGGE